MQLLRGSDGAYHRRVWTSLKEVSLWLTAGLLIAASVLKLANRIEPKTGSLELTAIGEMLVVAIEIGLAFWLMSGLGRRSASIAGMVLFIGFAGYSYFQLRRSAVSCGCFGAVEVSPRAAFQLDLGTSLVLGISAISPGKGGRFGPMRLATIALSSFIVAALVLLALRSFTIQSATDLRETDGIVILQTADWIGRRLPTEGHTEHSRDCRSGVWVLLFTRPGCDDCAREVSRCRRAASDYAKFEAHLTVVQLTPSPTDTAKSLGVDLVTSLRPGRTWFMRVPSVVVVRDGIVASWHTELPASL